MNKPAAQNVKKAVDGIQERLASYGSALNYNGLSAEAIHAAKVRIIDTLGALVGGFFGEPCQIARNAAADMPNPGGATVLGTRMKTTPDMAAFVNATNARYTEMTDSYHWPGSRHGHPSDTITPVLAAAEHAQVSGRDFIIGVVLAYEVYCRFSDAYHSEDFDHTNFGVVGVAVAAGKLLGLSQEQLSHCISMAVVPNVILRQVRLSELSMWKAVAAGQAGRAGVFAALLACEGMEGPHLPFEGKAGWCEHVAHERFSLDTMGGNGTPFKVAHTLIKVRPSEGNAISSILAAEKIGPLKNVSEVKQVIVETHRHALEQAGKGEERWNADSKESADHSIPYLVAAALIDGTVTPRSYDSAHLTNPQLRDLMKKTEVVENEEFTKGYKRLPQEHRTRVVVVTRSGERLVGEVGGDEHDMSAPKSDAEIEAKFRVLAEDVLGSKRVSAILERLWHLEDMANIAEIPSAFIIA